MMDETSEIIRLTAADYAVFGFMLALSAAVGIFFAVKERKSGNVEGYLLGGRQMHVIPTALSTSLSFLSGLSLLGIPAEIMYFGAGYCWLSLSTIISSTLAAEVFLPIYYRLELFSAYEYLELRFNKIIRTLATIVFLLQTIAYTGIMIYAPALALNAVSDFELWSAVLSVGIVCTLYTTLGGLKAVVWTDVLQGLIMAIMLLVVMFMSASSVGGFDVVWSRSREGDRLDFFHFDLDPRIRTTFWSIVFGLGMMWTSIGATNQAVVQRFLCCKSVTDGRRTIYTSIVCSEIFLCEIFVISFVTYAYYADCDPYLNGDVSRPDQVIPNMVLRILSDQPGLSGLFIAGIFAAALSTISSSINAMACVTVSDFIRPYFNWSEAVALWTSKGLALFYGAICIAFAFLSSVLGGLLQTSLSLLGICAGPLLGAVSLGIFFPVANSIGALCGFTSSFAMVFWLFAGSLRHPPSAQFTRPKSLSVEGCLRRNTTNSSVTSVPSTTTFSLTSNTTTAIDDIRPAIADFYAISYAYYSLFGFCVCLVIGLCASFASGGYQARKKVDPKLIFHPREHRLAVWIESKIDRSHSVSPNVTKQSTWETETQNNRNGEVMGDDSTLGRSNPAFQEEQNTTATRL